MKRKILIISILAAFMIVAISFASALNPEKTNKKTSPLFTIRTRKAINNKIEDVKTRFVGERLFFLPFKFLFSSNGFSIRQQIGGKTDYGEYTCQGSTSCGMPTECGLPCQTEFTYPTCGTVDCGCTVRPTILCGQCTQGIICRTLNDNCWN